MQECSDGEAAHWMDRDVHFNGMDELLLAFEEEISNYCKNAGVFSLNDVILAYDNNS
jgi:hypothetical protein